MSGNKSRDVKSYKECILKKKMFPEKITGGLEWIRGCVNRG